MGGLIESNRVEIGRVSAIYRYPVKSMRGQALPRVEVRWNGLDGDRQYAFVKSADTSRFPWATGRNFSDMTLWTARYDIDEKPRESHVNVTLDDGAIHAVTAPELVQRLSQDVGMPVALLHLGRGCFDSMPVSVVGQETLDDLAAKTDVPVAALRFRPNIVIDAGHERAWLGGRLAFGDSALRLRADRPIERCSMITLDPETAERAPKLMRTVVEEFNNEIGIYCTPEAPGPLEVGAKAWLERY